MSVLVTFMFKDTMIPGLSRPFPKWKWRRTNSAFGHHHCDGQDPKPWGSDYVWLCPPYKHYVSQNAWYRTRRRGSPAPILLNEDSCWGQKSESFYSSSCSLYYYSCSISSFGFRKIQKKFLENAHKKIIKYKVSEGNICSQ